MLQMSTMKIRGKYSILWLLMFLSIVGLSSQKKYKAKCPRSFNKYDNVGCFEDDVVVRALRSNSTIFGHENNVKQCVDFCAQSGDNDLAGLEFGECYCGTWEEIMGRRQFLVHPQMHCPHRCPKKNEMCGGLFRVSIYAVKSGAQPHAAPDCFQYPPGQTPFSGYDHMDARHNRNTATECYNHCNDKKYNYAAVQGYYCYCGKNVREDGVVRNAHVFACMDPCPGMHQEKCGAGKHMVDLYTIPEVLECPVIPAVTTPPPSPEKNHCCSLSWKNYYCVI